MSNDPTMTQAHDISTEFPATGLTPLTSMSSSAPISPPSSQFDINHFWDDGDVSSISVDEFSMFDLMDEPTDALASSRPMVQLDSAGHTTEAGSAAALNELVKSAGAHLPSSEAETRTLFDQSQHATEPEPDRRACDHTQGALALLLIYQAQPSEHLAVQEATDQQASASSTKQEVASAQVPEGCDSNQIDIETGSVRSEHSSSQEPEVPAHASPANPSSARDHPISKDHPDPMEAVAIAQGTPISSVGAALPPSARNHHLSNNDPGPSEATIGPGAPTGSVASALPSSTPDDPISKDHTAPTEMSTEQGNPASSADAVSSLDPPNHSESNAHNDPTEAATIDQGHPASSTDLCTRSGDSADSTYDLDPIQDEGASTPKSDHHEAGCESRNGDGVSAAAAPSLLSSKDLMDSATPSPKDRSHQGIPAASAGGPRSRSVSNVAELSYAQRRRDKQAAFKIPRGLSEAPSSALCSRSKRKRPLSSSEGASKVDPICIDDSDEEDESSPSTRPTDGGSDYAGQTSTKPLIPQKVVKPRSKRQRGKPNYIQHTNLEISSRFEGLEEAWSRLWSEMEVLREEQQSFHEYLQGIGYDD
ncbi:MAG: hypothetical protein LQ339_008514 [Xanthoria mediterranea]|nr:MAG: hypothetical protein LQ339_008514 [Xanthoria mediterranea]